MRALALSVNRAETYLAPDHAGVFETTLLSALRPGLVQLGQIPLGRDESSPDPVEAVGYAHRHDPTHPLWGVMGPDPRDYDPVQAQALLDAVVTWTRTQVEQALPPTS